MENDYKDFNQVSPPVASKTPEDRLARNPLITGAGFRNFLRLQQDPHAPLWNFETGDRIGKKDLAAYEAFLEALFKNPRPGTDVPSPAILDWINRTAPFVPAMRNRLPEKGVGSDNFTAIKPFDRSDVALRIHTLVPENRDLARMIVYDTSGTTGHAMVVPHHPQAVAKVLAMMVWVMSRHGIHTEFSHRMTACLNIGAQAQTVVFPNVLSVWQQAGFAKVNFHPGYWRNQEDAGLFFNRMQPPIITGDPTGFSEMLNWKISAKPGILFSTALFLSPDLKKRLTQTYRCPVVNWYSTTETGPIAYECREQNGLHLLPHDIFVEILNEDGQRLPANTRGEITVTGGRNPFLPLFRYKTGDFAALDTRPCPCGDTAPRLVGLLGREPVLFRDEKKAPVNPVDVGRVLRGVAFFQYRLVQRADASLDLFVKPADRDHPPDKDEITNDLKGLFGKNAEIRIHWDHALAERMAANHLAAYERERS